VWMGNSNERSAAGACGSANFAPGRLPFVGLSSNGRAAADNKANYVDSLTRTRQIDDKVEKYPCLGWHVLP
jgi:hypothetical protein